MYCTCMNANIPRTVDCKFATEKNIVRPIASLVGDLLNNYLLDIHVHFLSLSQYHIHLSVGPMWTLKNTTIVRKYYFIKK